MNSKLDGPQPTSLLLSSRCAGNEQAMHKLRSSLRLGTFWRSFVSDVMIPVTIHAIVASPPPPQQLLVEKLTIIASLVCDSRNGLENSNSHSNNNNLLVLEPLFYGLQHGFDLCERVTDRSRKTSSGHKPLRVNLIESGISRDGQP